MPYGDDYLGPELEDEHPDLAGLETPPLIVPAEEPPAAPAAADAFIDQTIAQPPPAQAAALPDLPGSVPNVPAPDGSPAPAAKPTDPTPESVEAGKRQLLTDQAQTLADRAAADDEAAKARKLDQDFIAAQAKVERDDATTRLQGAQERLSQERYDAAHPRQTFRDKIFVALAGIGGALAAAKSAAAGGSSENMGLRGINEKMRRETEAAQERIRNASDAVVQARAGVKDADEARTILERDADARDLNLRAQAEAALKRDLMRQGIVGAALDSDARMIQIRRDRKAAEEAAKDREVARNLKGAQTKEAEGKAAVYQRKAKGGAGGSGGYVSVQEAIDSGASRLAVARVAAKAGVPVPKAMQLYTAAEGSKKGEDAAKRGEARQETTDRKELVAEGKEFAKENQLPQLATAHQLLTKIVSSLSGDKPNPVNAQLALLELDKASKGGTATAASIDAVKSHLGGALDRFKGFLEGGESGNLAPEQIALLRGAAAAALAENKTAVDEKHEAFKSAFYADPTRTDQHEAVSSIANSLFGQFGYRNERAKGEPKGGAGEAPKADAGKVSRARAIVDDPKVPEAQKAGARNFLASQGQ